MTGCACQIRYALISRVKLLLTNNLFRSFFFLIMDYNFILQHSEYDNDNADDDVDYDCKC